MLSGYELAYIGDAVHTLFVRDFVLKSKGTIKSINRVCSRYCSAKYQSVVLDNIYNILSQTEQDIVRRGRNLDSKSRPKNATVEEYRKATALETLLGYLYLSNSYQRLQEILLMTMEEK